VTTARYRLAPILPWAALALLALPGIGASSYLTYSHYVDRPTICAGIGSCEFVQTSEYSEMAGIPVALMGLLYFIATGLLALARLLRLPWALDWAAPAAFSLSLGGAAFVTYLTGIELFVLDAICIWCVSVAVMTYAGLALTIWIRFSPEP